MSTSRRTIDSKHAPNDAGAIERLAAALTRIEALLPPAAVPDFGVAVAFRWRKRRYFGFERG